MDDILELLTSLKDKADNYIPPRKEVTRDILVNDSYGLLKASELCLRQIMTADLTSINNRYKYW